MPDTARLLAYLAAHDNPATVAPDGTLLVSTPYTDGRRIEAVAPTWADVRAHLGY